MDVMEFILIILLFIMGVLIILMLDYVIKEIISVLVHAELTHDLVFDYILFVAMREYKNGDREMCDSIFGDKYEENKEDGNDE